MDWLRSKAKRSKGTASTSSDRSSMQVISHPPRALEVVPQSVVMAMTTQTHDLAGNRHQDTPHSSANASNLQLNEQAPQGTKSPRSRNPSDVEDPTKTSEEARETSSNSASISKISLPQEGHKYSHSHVMSTTMTPASDIQELQKENQNVSGFFPYARNFHVINPTFIKVFPGSDTETPSFTESRDGQKLKKALVEGLEFIPLAKECMKDTRVTILSDIDARIHGNEDTNIIWIKGFPGVGKSALASTIVSRLRDQGELLSYFIFDRAKPTVTTTTALWRRVAWDLARLHPFARHPLLKRISDETLDVNTPNIGSLFTCLVVEPLSGLSRSESSDVELHQPVVVVIDAADECGGLEGPRSNDRKALLRTLGQWHSELPKNFKLVVTSREEDDIKRRISPISTHIHVSIGTDEASSDVRRYLEDRLREIADAYTELPVDWAHQTAERLAKRAAGVFIWATTITNFIEAGEPQLQLEDIDAGLGLGGEEGSLYALYTNVLRISFKNLRGKHKEAFKCVVGAMIFAQRPFRDSEFTAINPVVTGSMLEHIRNGLRSVVDQGATLRFIHQSFVDFLLSPECPEDVEPVFSPCSEILAASYRDEIKLLDTTTGELINLVHPIQTECRSLAFSRDGRYLASLTRQEFSVINIWDASTGMHRCCLAIDQTHNEHCFRLFFSSSDDRLVLQSLAEEGEEGWFVVRIWDHYMLDEPCTTVTLAFPNPRWLMLTLSPDTLTALMLERTHLGALFHCRHRSSIEEPFAPHALFDAAALGPKISEGQEVAFSPSGALFASLANYTGISLQIRVWETKTWTKVAGPFETGEILTPKSSRSRVLLSISPDDCLIRFASLQDDAIWVWDIRTGRRVAGPWRGYDLRRAHNAYMSPSGEKLVSTFYTETWTVRLWGTRGLCSGQAQEPVGGIGDFGDQSLIEDGWVKEEGSDSLLFWVPVEHRDGLWRPRNIIILGATLTKLNFSQFKYGMEWKECIDKKYMTRPQAD